MPTEYVSTVMDAFLYPDREEPRVLGDGTDETSKLQTHINNASAQGRIVILPPFTIKVTTLTIPNTGVTIWGVSGGSGQPASIIASTGINNPIIFCGSNVQNFIIKNVKVKGTNGSSNQHGIHVGSTDANLFEIENCYAVDCGGSGFKIETRNFNWILKGCYSSNNNEDGFYIDASNAICSHLVNCLVGNVLANKAAYNIPNGQVTMKECNSLIGVNANMTCVKVGNGITQAQVVFDHCNFESFTLRGVYVDDASDAVFINNCSFGAPSSGTVQPLEFVGPFGKSYIAPDTKFTTGGATYNNAGNLPVKVFSRGMVNSPFGLDPMSSAKVLTYWNSGDGRSEPFFNAFMRMPATTVTAASYTETQPTANYIGVNRAGAVAIVLFDPQSQTCPANRFVIVKDESGAAGANNITITTVNSRTIDGSASIVINTNYGRVALVQRGNNYWRVD